MIRRSFFLCIVVLSFASCIYCVEQLSDSPVQVAFFNVGQGNCTVIKHPDDKNLWIIDAGSSKNPYNILKEESSFGKAIVINNIANWIGDFRQYSLHLVLSHPDIDHYNFMQDILDSYIKSKLSPFSKPLKSRIFKNVTLYVSDKYDLSCYGFKTADINDLQNKKAIKVESITKESYVAQSNFSINFVNCASRNNADKNGNSLVIKFTYGKCSVLLTGDATKKTFESINPDYLRNITILQASHHGASTDGANDQSLIKATQPSYIVLSAPRYSSYGHPDWRIIKRFFQHLGTQKNGLKGFYKFFYLNKSIAPLDMNKEENNFANNSWIFYPVLSYQKIEKDDYGEFIDDDYYAICLTNCNIFHTGSHGTVIFSWKFNDIDVEVNTYDYCNDTGKLVDTTKSILFDQNQISTKLYELLKKEQSYIKILGIKLFGSSLDSLIGNGKYFQNLQALDLSFSSATLTEDLVEQILDTFKNLRSITPNDTLNIEGEGLINKILRRFLNMDK